MQTVFMNSVKVMETVVSYVVLKSNWKKKLEQIKLPNRFVKSFCHYKIIINIK